MIEELTEDEMRSQLETNLFGALWVTQAARPIMRAQGSGHIIQVSSLGGISALPSIGAYHASKRALEGFSQSLSQEVAGFGIDVTLIEPGGYTTDWVGPSAKPSEENPAYAAVREAQAARGLRAPGDPTATRGAILKVVDAEAAAADLLRQDADRGRDQGLRACRAPDRGCGVAHLGVRRSFGEEASAYPATPPRAR